MRLVCTFGLFLTLLHLSTALLLGAFNIQSFGNKKASDTDVMDIISEIVHRYDIILIQEVRDNDLSATATLMERVNGVSPKAQYSYIISEPLGRSTYKERYLFLYRGDRVSVVDSYLYAGQNVKFFSRQPFVVRFSSVSTAVQNFVLIPQHTSPQCTLYELNALYDVVGDVHNRWSTNNIVLLGDFNAGCDYVKNDDWQYVQLFSNKSFHWLITDEFDTTVSHTNCPYDRIVVTDDMIKGVMEFTANVFDFRMHPKFLEKGKKLKPSDISDHLPVEVELTPAP